MTANSTNDFQTSTNTEMTTGMNMFPDNYGGMQQMVDNLNNE